MGTALVLTAILTATAVALAVVLMRRRGRPPAEVAGADPRARIRTVAVDVVASEGPAAERVVATVARSTFDSSPELEEVVVVDRYGATLGRRFRERRAPLGPPPPELPPEHPAPHAQAPSPIARPRPAPVRLGEPPDIPPRHLADRFDLPAAVRSEIDDPDDPIELLGRLLEASGRTVTYGDHSLSAEGRFVTVIGASFDRPAIPRVLNEAYLAFLGAGAERGLVVSFDHLDRGEVERRELLAPEVRHVGPEGVQQMADAVALGGDPIAFVTGDAYTPTRG